MPNMKHVHIIFILLTKSTVSGSLKKASGLRCNHSNRRGDVHQTVFCEKPESRE